MKPLFSIGVNPDGSFPPGESLHLSYTTITATYLAAANGNLECLRTLLQNGYHGGRSCDESAICGAAENGHVDCLQLLLDYSALQHGKMSLSQALNAVEEIQAAVKVVSGRGFIICLRLLMDYLNKLINESYSSLKQFMNKSEWSRAHTYGLAAVEAAKYGRVLCLDMLLSQKDTSIDAMTPLVWAARHSHLNCVKLLLKHGAQIHWTDVACQRTASGSEIRYLLEVAGGSVDPE